MDNNKSHEGVPDTGIPTSPAAPPLDFTRPLSAEVSKVYQTQLNTTKYLAQRRQIFETLLFSLHESFNQPKKPGYWEYRREIVDNLEPEIKGLCQASTPSKSAAQLVHELYMVVGLLGMIPDENELTVAVGLLGMIPDKNDLPIAVGLLSMMPDENDLPF